MALTFSFFFLPSSSLYFFLKGEGGLMLGTDDDILDYSAVDLFLSQEDETDYVYIQE